MVGSAISVSTTNDVRNRPEYSHQICFHNAGTLTSPIFSMRRQISCQGVGQRWAVYTFLREGDFIVRPPVHQARQLPDREQCRTSSCLGTRLIETYL